MRNYSILWLVGIAMSSGCSVSDPSRPDTDPYLAPLTEPRSRSATGSDHRDVGTSNTRISETRFGDPRIDSDAELDSDFNEFSQRSSQEAFPKSAYVVNDFMRVVTRVPDFVPGATRFSAALPRTRYGELLLDALRQAGFTIVLGDAPDVPALRYSIELPTERSPDIHTFFISLGRLELKRSYEIFGDQIAPTSAMLMAGIAPESLTPVRQVTVARQSRSSAGGEGLGDDLGNDFGDGPANRHAGPDHELGVGRINQLIASNEDWDPLDENLYDTRTSVYEPMFSDATQEYENVSSQVLVFSNDSLVLGNVNKDYLAALAQRMNPSEDVIRLVGCSHGKTQLENGNARLARGRAIRVREELLLAGVDPSAILHEACWANTHFDEKFPRRGVVVEHLRPQG